MQPPPEPDPPQPDPAAPIPEPLRSSRNGVRATDGDTASASLPPTPAPTNTAPPSSASVSAGPTHTPVRHPQPDPQPAPQPEPALPQPLRPSSISVRATRFPMIVTGSGPHAYRSSLHTLSSRWKYWLSSDPIPLDKREQLEVEVMELQSVERALEAHLFVRKHFKDAGVNSVSYATHWLDVISGKEHVVSFLDRELMYPGHAGPYGDSLDCLCLDFIAQVAARVPQHAEQWWPLLTKAARSGAARAKERLSLLLRCLRSVCQASPRSLLVLIPLAESPVEFVRIALSVAPDMWTSATFTEFGFCDLFDIVDALTETRDQPQDGGERKIPMHSLQSHLQRVIDAFNTVSGSNTAAPLREEAALRRVAGHLSRALLQDATPGTAKKLLHSAACRWLDAESLGQHIDRAEEDLGDNGSEWVAFHLMISEHLPIIGDARETLKKRSMPQSLRSQLASVMRTYFELSSNRVCEHLGHTIAKEMDAIAVFVALSSEKNWWIAPSVTDSQRTAAATIAIEVARVPEGLGFLCREGSRFVEWLRVEPQRRAGFSQSVEEAVTSLSKAASEGTASRKLARDVVESRVAADLPPSATLSDAVRCLSDYVKQCHSKVQTIQSMELAAAWLRRKVPSFVQSPLGASGRRRNELDTLSLIESELSSLALFSAVAPFEQDDGKALELLRALVGRDRPSTLYELMFDQRVESNKDAADSALLCVRETFHNIVRGENIPSLEVIDSKGLFTPDFHGDLSFLRRAFAAEKLYEAFSGLGLISGVALLARLLPPQNRAPGTMMGEAESLTRMSLEEGRKWLESHGGPALKLMWTSCEIFLPLLTTIQASPKPLLLPSDALNGRDSEEATMKYALDCWRRIAPLKNALCECQDFKGIQTALESHVTPNTLLPLRDAWSFCNSDFDSLQTLASQSDSSNSTVWIDADTLRKLEEPKRYVVLAYLPGDLDDGFIRGLRTVVSKGPDGSDRLAYDHGKTRDLFQQVITSSIRETELARRFLDGWRALSDVETVVDDMIAHGFPIGAANWRVEVELFPDRWSLQRMQGKLQALRNALIKWQQAVKDVRTLCPELLALSWSSIGRRCLVATDTTLQSYNGDRTEWHGKLQDLMRASLAATTREQRPESDTVVDVVQFVNCCGDADRIVGHVLQAVVSAVGDAPHLLKTLDVGVLLVDSTSTLPQIEWLATRAKHWRGVYVLVVFSGVYCTPVVTALIHELDRLRSCKAGRFLIFMEKSGDDVYPKAVHTVGDPRELTHEARNVSSLPPGFCKLVGSCSIVASSGPASGKSTTARLLGARRAPLLDNFSAIHTLSRTSGTISGSLWFDVSQYILEPLAASERMGVANELAGGPVALGMRLLVLFRDCELHCGASMCSIDPSTKIIIEQPVLASACGSPCAVLPLFLRFADSAEQHCLIDSSSVWRGFSLDKTDRNIDVVRGVALAYEISRLDSGAVTMENATTTTAQGFGSKVLKCVASDTAPPVLSPQQERDGVNFVYQVLASFKILKADQVFCNFVRLRVFFSALSGLLWGIIPPALLKDRVKYLQFARLCVRQAAFVSCPMPENSASGMCELSLAAVRDWGIAGIYIPALASHPNVYFWNLTFYASIATAEQDLTTKFKEQYLLDDLVDTPNFNAVTNPIHGAKSSTCHAKNLLRFVVGCRETHRDLLHQHLQDVVITPTVFLRVLIWSAWAHASVPRIIVGEPAEGKTFLTDRIAAFRRDILYRDIRENHWKQELGAILAQRLFIPDPDTVGKLKSGNKPTLLGCVEEIRKHCENTKGISAAAFFCEVISRMRQSFPLVHLDDNPSTWESKNATEYATAALERLINVADTPHQLQLKLCALKVVLHPSKLALPGVLDTIRDFADLARRNEQSQLLHTGDKAGMPTRIGCDLVLDEWTTASQLGFLMNMVSLAVDASEPSASWCPLRLTLITNPHLAHADGEEPQYGAAAPCPVHPLPIAAASLAMIVSPLPEAEALQYHRQLLKRRLSRRPGDTAKLSELREMDELSELVSDVIIRSASLIAATFSVTTQRDIVHAADAMQSALRLCELVETTVSSPSTTAFALALVIDVVLASRLPTDDERRAYLQKVSTTNEWSGMATTCAAPLDVAEAADACSRWLVNDATFRVPNGIVLEAMRRYVCAMLICATATPPIPLAIVDEPGTGKTESARILEDNMSSLHRTKFFSQLQSLRDVIIHGRADATSESIERGFSVAEREAEKLESSEATVESSKTIIRVLYDEANLASQSLANKALHRPFDERRVAVACLLNAPFDRPNMTRCVNVVNASAHEDLITGHLAQRAGAELPEEDARLRAATISGCTKLLKRPFFHRRDLTFFLLGLKNYSPETIAKAAAMNFDGDDSWESTTDTPQLCAVQTILETSGIRFDKDRLALSWSDILSVDRMLHLDDDRYMAKYRFLMIVDRSHDYWELDCMLQNSDARVRSALQSYERLFFSTFVEDRRSERNSDHVARFRAVFTEGQRALAQNWVEHCTPFLAVLNRSLSAHPGTRNPVGVFPLSSGTKKGEVKREALLVVVVKSTEVRQMLPQIRSRFEAHFADAGIDSAVLSALEGVWTDDRAVSKCTLRSASSSLLFTPTTSDVRTSIVGVLPLLGHELSSLERAALLLAQGLPQPQVWHMLTRLGGSDGVKEVVRELYYQQQPFSLDDVFRTKHDGVLRKPWMIFTRDREGCQQLDEEAAKWRPRQLHYDQRPRIVDVAQFTSQDALQRALVNEIESSRSPLLLLLSDTHPTEHINFVRHVLLKCYNDALREKRCPPFCVGMVLRSQINEYPLAFAASWNVVFVESLFPCPEEQLAVALLRRSFNAPASDVESTYIHCCAKLLVENRHAQPPAVVNEWREDLPDRAAAEASSPVIEAATFYRASVDNDARIRTLVRVVCAHETIRSMVQIPSPADVRKFWAQGCFSEDAPPHRLGFPRLTSKLAKDVDDNDSSGSNNTKWMQRSVEVLERACYGYGLLSLESAAPLDGALRCVTRFVTQAENENLYRLVKDVHWSFVPACPFNPWLLDYLSARATDYSASHRTEDNLFSVCSSALQRLAPDSALETAFSAHVLQLFAEDLKRHPDTVDWATRKEASELLDALATTLEKIYPGGTGHMFSTVFHLAVAAVYATRKVPATSIAAALRKQCSATAEALSVITCQNTANNCPGHVVLGEANDVNSLCDVCSRGHRSAR